MPKIDKKTALAEIDDVLKAASATEFSISLACAALKRLCPPGSVYLDRMNAALSAVVAGTGDIGFKNTLILTRLHDVLKALRAGYEADRLQSFEEMIHADLFSDFLAMAEYFLSEGYKDPAAVIAGGVLEQHLRKLCAKHGIALPPKPKLDTMNADLAKAGAYGKNDQKQVTAWADLRNDAAHGNYLKYTPEQVKLMAAWIRDFISRNPA